jgi:hypothetical protein
MGSRIRVLTLVLVLSGVGLFLGSFLAQWGNGGQPEPPSAVPGSRGRVRVEVLNGGGLAGVAREATRVLRDAGFDVVYFGNAGTFSQDSSVVMGRVSGKSNAGAVADVLGIPGVREEPDTTRYVDVTVRLGPEWRPPGEAVEVEEPEAPWWDVRKLFKGNHSIGS